MDVIGVLLGEVRVRHLVEAAHVVAEHVGRATVEIDDALRGFALLGVLQPVVPRARLEQPGLHRLGLGDEREDLSIV